MNEKLKHLSEGELNQLIHDYYHTDKSVNVILDEYKVNVHSGSLYRLFPPEETDDQCPYCSVPMVVKRSGRYTYSKPVPCCSECGHTQKDRCRCLHCTNAEQEARVRLVNAKREKIQAEYFVPEERKLEPIDLTETEWFYLVTLMRSGLNEKMDKIRPLGEMRKFAPTLELTSKIMSKLFSRTIIVPHLDSPIDAFKDDEDFPSVILLNKAEWYINVKGPKELFINRDIVLSNPGEAWKEIALHECLEYLAYNAKKLGFDLVIGEKTEATMVKLLEDFSVSQVYSIIYRSATNASRFYQENKISRRHAANTVVSNCRKYGERALVEGWDVRGFRRNYDLPQSEISQFLYDSVLNIGEMGFEEPPTSL